MREDDHLEENYEEPGHGFEGEGMDLGEEEGWF